MEAIVPSLATSSLSPTALELPWMSPGLFPFFPEALPWNTSNSNKPEFALSSHDWSLNAGTAIKALPRHLSVTDPCSDPASVTMPDPGIPLGSIGLNTAMVRLSKLNVDVHARIAAAEAHRASLSLESVIYRTGPLFMNNMTLGFTAAT